MNLVCHDLPILAVAKGKRRNAGEEKIYHEGKEYILEKNDPLLFFIQRLRDEAHRFAISTAQSQTKEKFKQITFRSNTRDRKTKKKSFVKSFWFSSGSRVGKSRRFKSYRRNRGQYG